MNASGAMLPLQGVRVIEMTHMVMGPTCGLVLADLGAEVIKVEPPGAAGRPGEHTRYLKGAGAGFFAACNRNKQSVILDLDTASGRETLYELAAGADVFLENFRPGALAERGLGYEALSARNPGLVYCSLKGFLDGPYAERTALDEVAQMMSGLAYMTGPVGQPLRAGAPVNDMMGGMFGAIAVMAALRQRERSGRGQHVVSGLFENAAWLVSTHMLQQAITGVEPPPMSAGRRAWGVYDVFQSADGKQIFIGVVTERQWQRFTEALGEPELRDPAYGDNNARAQARPTLIPLVGRLLARRTLDELQDLCARAGLPFAPIARPWDLFDDPHLNAAQGLLPITLADGSPAKVPGLPIQFDGQRLGVRRDVPRPGEHNNAVLSTLTGTAGRKLEEKQ
ncbi:CaiB/BaiF CoA transferase family protein [Bordetella bronchiseptica]|uniref:CaiB/BaiF CoA transferase family protein n=1 Tax=Bordetella bronchiseptica TaxID=518 RepID=UPI000461DFDD|nr:CoA transferase [Bordetella bronchiseptica]AWP73579.1 CoA transferase [Bordetella bronchiseptica]KDB96571.1 CoA-transferase family III protein [Bordetella bronchiseptica E010]KDC01504.1 CoA-transferase family III protein [Bordetella bronchiseptica D993]KDD33788.1 CoA-transferase family III protein [Bordetella bronchiseptica MBORD839]KFJ55558.1 coA-transferase III family protein [Bordetella bronchiseptica]